MLTHDAHNSVFLNLSNENGDWHSRSPPVCLSTKENWPKIAEKQRHPKYKVKVKQSHYRPGQSLGFQEVEAPRFQDNRHMKVVRLSASLMHRPPLPAGNIPGTRIC